MSAGSRYALGAVLAAIALYFALRGVSHDAVRDAMHAASLAWTVAALCSTLATILLVTWRWGLLLGLPTSGHWGQLWNAVVIGQAVNIIVPLRFGEAARVAAMARSTGWPMGRVATAMVVERACDLAAFAAMLALLVVSGRLPARFAGPLPMTILVMLLAMVGAAAAIRLLPRIVGPDQAGPNAVHTRRSRLMEWLRRQSAGVQEAWNTIMTGPRVTAVLILTGLTLASSASTNYLIFRAFDIQVPALAAFVLLAVLQVGTAVVSVPGNVGILQYLTVLTLAVWRVDASVALAASLLLHLVGLGPRVVLGAVAAATLRGSGR